MSNPAPTPAPAPMPAPVPAAVPSPAPAKVDPSLNNLTWRPLVEGLVIPAKPAGIWTLACDFVPGPAAVKITATGEWTYSTRFGNMCSPDGDLLAPLNRGKVLCPKCPVGALIAKLGGSSSDTESGTNIHPAGSFAVLIVQEADQGALFLTINDLWDGWGDNEGKLQVTVAIHEFPKP